MMTKTKIPSFEECITIAKYFYESMHDYIFLYDIEKDEYEISYKAYKKFRLPSNHFKNVKKNHKLYVYEEDYPILLHDLELVTSGKQNEHNLVYRWMGRDSKPYWINCRGKLLRDENGKPKLILGCVSEIGNDNLADNITGLLGEEPFKKCIKENQSLDNNGYIMKIGIDDLRTINEHYGLDYGNGVLKGLANIIKDNLYNFQNVYRLKNDEFAIIDLNRRGYDDAKWQYEKIRKDIVKSIVERKYEGIYTVSGGLIVPQEEKRSVSSIMRDLEFSLDMAKKKGKNQLYLYNKDDYQEFIQRTHLIQALNKAVENDFKGFDLFFQPIVNHNTGDALGAEALLRFKLDDKYISPTKIIPLLEETGLIIAVGEFIIKRACLFLNQVRKYHPNFRVSINVSYIQILKGVDFISFFDILRDYNLPNDAFIVELTESGYLESNELVNNAWKGLKNNGFGIAIDDFGTGYSNIHNISMLNPNIIKIDKSFTDAALKSSYDFELLRNLILMAHGINTYVIVEGIEKKEDLLRIISLNPDFIQGYYYSKPMSGFEYIQNIKTNQLLN